MKLTDAPASAENWSTAGPIPARECRLEACRDEPCLPGWTDARSNTVAEPELAVYQR